VDKVQGSRGFRGPEGILGALEGKRINKREIKKWKGLVFSKRNREMA